MKKTSILNGLLLIVTVLFTNQLFAQLELTGEFRPRTEYRHGYKALSATNADAAFFTSQRTRFNVFYAGEDFKVGFSLQDVRTWGSVKQLNTTDDFLAVHEAWAQYFFNENFSIKLGRQEVVYDDHRIFGSVGWAQQARSHDLAIFKFVDNNFKMDAGFAFNQDKENLFGTAYTVNGGKNYKTFQYLWAHTNMGKVGVSFLVLNNGIQYETGSNANPTYDISYSQTYGVRLTYKLNRLSLAGAAYAQGGKNGARKDLSAYYLAGEAFYKLADEFQFGIGFELLSGNDYEDLNSSTDNTFTPFYGTNHKFNGFMDYFFVGNNANGVGLHDMYVSAKYKKDKFSANLTTHFFTTHGEMASAVQKKRLGTELDINFAYKFNKQVALAVGYSQMFADDTLAFLRGGDLNENNNWVWVMFTFKPKFL